jgi:uncharacterized protein (DUF433 family)
MKPGDVVVAGNIVVEANGTEVPTISEQRFSQALYTVPQAARLVGMNPGTLATWAHGYERTVPGRVRPVQKGPIITALAPDEVRRAIPFVGLVEATVVQAFRQTGLPMQRIRNALEVLADQGELHHALASERLFSDGAQLLYTYANEHDDRQLGLLTVVKTGQRVFHDVIDHYLKRIVFDGQWATALVVPVTERPILRVLPGVAGGEPIFVHGGAPLGAVRSRAKAGEPLQSIAADYGVPIRDIEDALASIWPEAA